MKIFRSENIIYVVYAAIVFVAIKYGKVMPKWLVTILSIIIVIFGIGIILTIKDYLFPKKIKKIENINYADVAKDVVFSINSTIYSNEKSVVQPNKNYQGTLSSDNKFIFYKDEDGNLWKIPNTDSLNIEDFSDISDNISDLFN